MNSKEVKKLLIEARDALKSKNYTKAQQNCKTVLALDASNYNAFVFLGAVYQETKDKEKCLKVFRKAIEISPYQITAWQGLRSFYEKDSMENGSDNSLELISVYEKLLDLYGDEKLKKIGVLQSLATIQYEVKKDIKKAVEFIVEGLALSQSEPIDEYGIRLVSLLIDWLSSELCLNERYLELLIDGVKKLCDAKISGVSHVAVKSNFADKYLNHLLKAYVHEDGSSVLESVLGLDSFVDPLSGDKTLEFRFYFQIARGTSHYQNGRFVEAKKDFVAALNTYKGKGWEGWLLFCRVLEKLRDGIFLEQSAIEGLKVFSLECFDDRFKMEFKLLQAVGVLYQGEQSRLESVLGFLNEVINIEVLKSKALFTKGLIHLKMKNWVEAREVVSSLTSSPDQLPLAASLEGSIYSQRGDYALAKEKFHQALEINPKDAYVILELGIINWKLKNYSLAHSYFLQAAKIDSYNATTFLMLGHYYRDVMDDYKRAQRCYKVAYDLNKRDDEIGISLSDCYRTLGEDDANLAFLIAVTSEANIGRCGWAWLRLGFLHLHRDEPEKAIGFLQAALRVDPSNRVCWECLGEAYLLRGSHSSAIKAFNKALELEPDLLYCKYQIANIKLCLGFFKDAIDSFKQIIEVVPSYVPALKGQGEAYLAQARCYLDMAIHRSAFDCCEAALIPLTRAVVQKPNFLCLWKLLGDACTMISFYTPAMLMRVPTALTQSQSTAEGEFINLDEKEVLTLGVRCYIICTRHSDCNSNLWHDVGVAHYRLALVSDQKSVLLQKAVNALKKAISLKPGGCSYWYALGIVACAPELKKYALAQHCFIRAVKAEPNNVVAWTNLGTLYLIHGNVQLANKSFVVAQSIDPSYVNCWIGQALCAESIGHHDTLDLFRHCTNLGYHPEGSIGYASWVCNILLDSKIHHTEMYRYNIEDLAAIEAATDSAFHYTGSIVEDPCAFNILGLLLERQSMFAESERSFRKALKLVTLSLHSAMCNDDDGNRSKSQLMLMQCNLARVLRCMGRFKDAYLEASSVEKLDFYNVHCQAFAFYQAEMIEESAEAFNVALNLAKTDEERSHLRISMGSIVYKLQGPFEAKTLLFECLPLKPTCVQALLALASIGLLQSDSDLTGATIQELEPWLTDPRFAAQIHYLQSITFGILDCNLAARNVFCKVLHQWPGDWVHWKRLSIHLIKYGDQKMAFRCLSSSLRTSSAPSMEVLQLFCTSLILIESQAEGLSAAKKLVHHYPDEKRNWQILNFVKVGNTNN